MAAEIEIDVDGLESAQAAQLLRVNAALARLSERRRREIRVEGPLARSMLAWKLATLQEGFLYRTVTLVRGVALTWNTRNFLTTILAARSLIETLVLVEDFKAKLDVSLKAHDLSGVNQLLDHLTFATRDAEWLAEHPESQATNIQTLINRFDKNILPGARAHYDSLSERCHPNSRGHFGMFAALDRSSGTVAFSDTKNLEADRAAIMPAVVLFLLFEHTMDWFDGAVLEIADLQHRLNPACALPPLLT
jgi:hypothetical protein